MAAVSSSVLSSAPWLWRQAKPPLPECHGQAQILPFSRAESAVFCASQVLLKSGAGRVSALAMITSSSGGPSGCCPAIPVSISTSTGPPVMIRCSTVSRRMRMSLRCPSTDAVSTTPSRRSRPRKRTAAPGEHEGLERPGDERDERKREQEGGDAKNDAVGVRRRGHFRVLNVSGRRLAAKACLPAPNKTVNQGTNMTPEGSLARQRGGPRCTARQARRGHNPQGKWPVLSWICAGKLQQRATSQCPARTEIESGSLEA